MGDRGQEAGAMRPGEAQRGLVPITPIEAVNPALDAFAREHPDDRHAWLVYADWLSEQGDPRAGLVRLQSAQRIDREAEAAYIDLHWDRWFGVDPDRLQASWKNGFVDALRQYPRMGERDASPALLEAPVLRFLRRLDAFANHMKAGELQGVDRLPGLSRLCLRSPSSSLQGSLRGLTLPGLETLRWLSYDGERLEVVPDATSVDTLLSLHLPSLRRFELSASRKLPLMTLLRALDAAPWFRRLEGLALGPLGAPEQEWVRARAGALRRLGRGLHLSVSLVQGPEWDKPLRDLSRLFPEAHVHEAPYRSGGFRFHAGGPSANEVPTRAPPHFMDLPPRVAIEPDPNAYRKSYGDWHGSGVPFEPGTATHRSIQHCFACGSSDTLCIFRSDSWSEGRSETYSFNACELVCRECGRFTAYESSSES